MKASRFKLIAVAVAVSIGGGSALAGDGAPKAPAPAAPPAAADAKAGPGAHLTIEKDVVDLGEVIRGQPATAVFEIRNTGDQVLKILSARPG